MTEFSRWADSGHRERAEERAGGRDAFQAGVAKLIGEARAWRLVEMRKERGFTQTDVAARMAISLGRVSQIENGQLSGNEVIARYIQALGGSLVMVAVFDDGELPKVG